MVELQLNGDMAEELDITVCSSSGKKISEFSRVKEGSNFSFTMPVDNLPSGVCFYHVHFDRGLNFSGRFVVIK